MSILSKIRDNVGLVITVIAISLAVFILTDFFRSSRGTRPDSTVATVAGRDVSYEELQQALEAAERDAEQQMQRMGQEFDKEDPATMAQIKQQAWNTVIFRAILAKEADDLGIGVSDAELKVLFFGPAFSQAIGNHPEFLDSTGRYVDTTKIGQFMAAADQAATYDDPQFGGVKRFMRDVRNEVIDNRIQEKYFAMIRGAGLVSDNEVKTALAEESRSANYAYVVAPYSLIPDAEVVPTDADYQSWYEKHKYAYKRPMQQVRLKYAAFDVMPSREDSATLRMEMAQLKKDMMSGSEAMYMAYTQSATPFDTNYVLLEKVPEAVKALCQAGRTDTVIGPVLDKKGLKMYKVMGIKQDSNYTYKARHIFLTIPNDSNADTAKVEARARELAGRLTKENFADSARVLSQDPSTAGAGGNLDWMRPSPAAGGNFKQVLEGMAVGSISVARSINGFHVILLEDKTNTFYQVAQPVRPFVVSTETSDSLYQRASQFLSKLRANATFEDANKEFPDAKVYTSQWVSQNESSVPGVNGGRPVILWGFKNELNKLCDDVIESSGNKAMVIAQVIGKSERGIAPLEDIKEEIKPLVIQDLKAKKLKEKMAAAGQDFNQVAASMGQGARTLPSDNAMFSSATGMTIGVEPLVIGRLFGMKPGEVSKPIAGNQGVYMVKLIAINEGPAATPEAIAQRRTQMLQSKGQNMARAAAVGLQDLAEIEDYRYKYDF